jgi:hypothetical protein
LQLLPLGAHDARARHPYLLTLRFGDAKRLFQREGPSLLRDGGAGRARQHGGRAKDCDEGLHDVSEV